VASCYGLVDGDRLRHVLGVQQLPHRDRRCAIDRGSRSSVNPADAADQVVDMGRLFADARATVSVYGFSGATSASLPSAAVRTSTISTGPDRGPRLRIRSTARLRAWWRPLTGLLTRLRGQVAAVAEIHLQLVSGVDEQRHIDLRAGFHVAGLVPRWTGRPAGRDRVRHISSTVTGSSRYSGAPS